MTVYAFYNLQTGLIQSTLNQPITDKAQLEGLAAQGIGMVAVDDDVHGSNAVIDVKTKLATRFNAAPAPVPNILVQYIASQIKGGMLSVNDFHPVTVAEMNGMLTQANMTPIATSDESTSVSDTVGAPNKAG